MNVLFDMETGDPDDLITLLLLLNNPTVALRGITCYQGSAIQIGLINHVLRLANKEGVIPVGGWNPSEPSELSNYYPSVVGKWASTPATLTPVEVFKQVFESYPDTQVLTGAPLTNVKLVLEALPNLTIASMTTQGGYLGELVSSAQQLSKFKNKTSIRTYNLSQDPEAFDAVNSSSQIQSLTFITKDLCHGFMYTPEIHKSNHFSADPVGQLLKKCLAHYALSGKSKAMHDPLAMLYMLNPSIGQTANIHMGYRLDDKNHAVFSSQKMEATNKVSNVNNSGNGRQGLVAYSPQKAWGLFTKLCGPQSVALEFLQRYP